MPISDTLDRWQQAGDEHLFKLIVSPEFGDRMDLKQHVKEVVQHMEKDLKTKLQWVAVEHHNTDNPHVHVVVRGVDDRGEKLEVSPVYIKEGSRVRAQEAATRQLGYRSELDVAEALDRQVTQQRFTDLDRALVKKAVNLQVTFDAQIPKSERARETRVRQIRRLAQLEAMGLATRRGPMSWQLSPALESALRQMQVSQDRLKTKFQHRELITDPAAPLVATELKVLGQRVAGRVVGAGLNEVTSRPYLMVEGFDGRVHYLTQTAQVEKMRGAGELKAGDFIALEVVERRDRDGKTSGVMVRAERYGSKMTPELLDRELLRAGRPVEPITAKQTVAGAFLDAAAKRLQRLRDVGAVDIEGGQVRMKSAPAHDRVRFEDAGLQLGEREAGAAALAKVVMKGRASVALKGHDGRGFVLTAAQLEAMGLDQKFVARDATLFVGVDAKGKVFASVVKLAQVPTLIQDLRPNKLDLMAQQLRDLPAADPLASAIKQRTEVWRQRGVDPMDPKFSLKASSWRKSVELHEAAQEKGVKNVLDDLARDRGKPVRELECTPGRQVSGRVLLVTKEDSQTSVVVDSGRELTLLRQPAPSEADLKAGQRVRARAEEVNDANTQRRIMMWRFADLEREQARSKSQERNLF